MTYPNYFVPPSTKLLMPIVTKDDLNRSFNNMAVNFQNQSDVTDDINWGNVAEGAIAGAGMLANTIGMANQRLDVDENAPAIQYSTTGQPVYDSSFYSQAMRAKPQGTTFGEAVSSAGNAAATGFKVGGVKGAIVGGLIGLGSSIFGGNARKRAMERQKRRVMASARAQQKSFNEASKAFESQQMAQQDYIRRRNMTNRLYNLYQPIQ